VGSLNNVIAEVGCHFCSLHFVGLLCRCLCYKSYLYL